MLWLELSEGVFGPVDESEGAGPVATEFGPETEDDGLFQGSVESLGDELLKVFLGADGGVFVIDLDEELGSVQ